MNVYQLLTLIRSRWSGTDSLTPELADDIASFVKGQASPPHAVFHHTPDGVLVCLVGGKRASFPASKAINPVQRLNSAVSWATERGALTYEYLEDRHNPYQIDDCNKDKPCSWSYTCVNCQRKGATPHPDQEVPTSGHCWKLGHTYATRDGEADVTITTWRSTSGLHYPLLGKDSKGRMRSYTAEGKYRVGQDHPRDLIASTAGEAPHPTKTLKCEDPRCEREVPEENAHYVPGALRHYRLCRFHAEVFDHEGETA